MPKIDSERVFWRKVEGRTLLCDSLTGAAYALEGTADLIWQLLTVEKNTEDIVAEVAMACESDPSEAREDIEVFLTQLKEAGLIS